jgi:hypothetical protein
VTEKLGIKAAILVSGAVFPLLVASNIFLMPLIGLKCIDVLF